MARVYIVYDGVGNADEMRLWFISVLGTRMFLDSRHRWTHRPLPPDARRVVEVVLSFGDDPGLDAEHLRTLMRALNRVYHRLRQRHDTANKRFVELVEAGALKNFFETTQQADLTL